MTSTEEAAYNRAHCARHFCESSRKKAITVQADLDYFRREYLPEGYSARLPRAGEVLNTFFERELVFPIRHFEAGLRFPLWPEYCQILRYFGLVPAQIAPNGVAMIIGFLCFLRSEGIAFDLGVFRRVFAFSASKVGVAYFSSHQCTIVGTVGKVHRWDERIVIVKGDFQNIPLRPRQPGEAAFMHPVLGSAGESLWAAFKGRKFNVAFWRERVGELPYVHPGEGTLI